MKGFVLNFHGVGNPDRPLEPGEGSYWLTSDEFRSVLDLIVDTSPRMRIGITFDDGNASDYAIGMPELVKRGLVALVFPLAGKVDARGYLTRGQLRDLTAEGFQIGSHGMYHVDWTSLPAAQLRDEVQSSRAILEEIVQKPVHAAGVPFGRYDRRVLSALKKSGYQAVYSSDGGPRLRELSPIPRYSVKRNTDLRRLKTRILSVNTVLSQVFQEAKISLKSFHHSLPED